MGHEELGPEVSDGSAEERAGRRLVDDLFPRVEVFQRRWDSGDHEVHPGSSLAGDDQWSKPYQLSQTAWLALGHAIDDLHALRALTLEGDETNRVVVTRPFGAYPLIRAAFENSMLALWLLGPHDRNLRLMRRFRLLLADGKHRDQMIELAGHGQPGEYSRRLEVVRSLAAARGISINDCQKRADYSTIVAEASAVIGTSANQALAVWRSLSGLTHGDMWASLMATEKEQVAVSADGEVLTVRLTSSISNIANLASAVVAKTGAGLKLFDNRRSRQV